MDFSQLLQNLALGFSVALSPDKLAIGFAGVLVGSAIGVLPGLGPSVAIALLLPLTFGLEPTSAFILFGGIFYGAMFGGSITSILINTPGDAAAAVTTFDGYPMARKGQAGVALASSAIASFIGGTLGTFLLMVAATGLTAMALLFGPPEYFSLMLLALSLVAAASGGTPARAAVALCLGLLVSTIGIDLQTGVARFTFGLPELYGGIDVALGAVGLFAIGEAFWLIAAPPDALRKEMPTNRIWLTLQEWKRCAVPWLRGSVLGFLIGVLPGTGASMAAFLSYGVERRVAKNPEEFGTGRIEGVAGPEAANNGAAAGSMVPLLALGIPGSGTTAIMLVAFQMYGLQPGPSLIENNGELVWGLIASLYVANVLLVIINLPMVGFWVKLLKTPKSMLAAIMILFGSVGAYAAQGSVGDVIVVWVLGIGAFLLRRFGFPVAPVLIGLVLGPMIEQELRRSLAMSSGDWTIFFTRPISLGVLVVLAVSLLLTLWSKRRRPAADQFLEDE